jgi:hypothetical protein
VPPRNPDHSSHLPSVKGLCGIFCNYSIYAHWEDGKPMRSKSVAALAAHLLDIPVGWDMYSLEGGLRHFLTSVASAWDWTHSSTLSHFARRIFNLLPNYANAAGAVVEANNYFNFICWDSRKYGFLHINLFVIKLYTKTALRTKLILSKLSLIQEQGPQERTNLNCAPPVLVWMQQRIYLLLKVADSGIMCQKNCV